MKVLLLAPGTSPHSQRLIQLLLEQGCTVTCLDTKNPLSSASSGYEFIVLPRVRGTRFFFWFRSQLETWISAAQLWWLWRRIRPDVVNVQWIDSRAVACAKANLRPLVLSCWGSDINNLFLDDPPQEEDRRRVGRALATADYVTADSSEILERCDTLAGKSLASKLFFFGIDPNKFKAGYREAALALRRTLGIAEHSKVILSPRRLNPLLGQRYIVEAFASIAADPQLADAVLVLRYYLGSSETFRHELEQQIERLGIARRVFWLGDSSYDEMPACYNMADLVVNYPERDGFPVSLFEAAMSERPVITSRLPAYAGVFGDAFVEVPPGNARELANALRRCLTEPPELARQRVRRAQSIALEVGDQNKSIRVMTDIFHKVCTQTR